MKIIQVVLTSEFGDGNLFFEERYKLKIRTKQSELDKGDLFLSRGTVIIFCHHKTQKTHHHDRFFCRIIPNSKIKIPRKTSAGVHVVQQVSLTKVVYFLGKV